MGTGDDVLYADRQLEISTWHSCLILKIATQCCVFDATSPVILSKILRE